MRALLHFIVKKRREGVGGVVDVVVYWEWKDIIQKRENVIFTALRL